MAKRDEKPKKKSFLPFQAEEAAEPVVPNADWGKSQPAHEAEEATPVAAADPRTLAVTARNEPVHAEDGSRCPVCGNTKAGERCQVDGYQEGA